MLNDNLLMDHFGFTSNVCPYCGDEAELDVNEVWAPRDFQLSTCCDSLHDLVCYELAQEDKDSSSLLRKLGLDCLGLGKLRRVVNDGCGRLVLDWNLELCQVDWKTAKAFVAKHHEHCPAPVGWKFGGGIRNGQELIGVITVGRPVARAYDARKVIVEVNRLCVRRDMPSGLAWNACSLAYGFAAREAKKRGYETIITYTLESEDATTLKASGWTMDGTTQGGSRSCQSRPRVDKTSTERKNRWKKELTKGPGLGTKPERSRRQTESEKTDALGAAKLDRSLEQALIDA